MGVRKSELVTGIFIVVGLLLLTVVSIAPVEKTFLGAGQVHFVAYFDNVALLQEKALVSLNGVDVGLVIDLRNVEQSSGAGVTTRVRVVFTMAEEVATSLRSGTKAMIGQESMLSSKHLEVLPSLVGSELVKEDEKFLVETIPYGDILTTIGALGDEVGPVLAEAKALIVKLKTGLLSDRNLESISSILVKVDGLGTQLTEMLGKTDANLNGAGGLFDQLRGVTEEVNTTLVQLRTDIAAVRDMSTDTMRGVDGLVANTDRAITDARRLLNDEVTPKLEELSMNTNRLLTRLDSRVDPTFNKVCSR